jgi:hypothetical protein
MAGDNMKRFGMVLMMVVAFTLSCSHTNRQSAGDSSRNPAGEEYDDPWTEWSRGKNQVAALLVLKKIREDLLVNSLHDPHVSYAGYGDRECTDADKMYRSADGTCYYMNKPYVGAAGVAFGRNVDPKFIDKDAAEKIMKPNPKLVADVLFTRDEFKEVPFLNMIAASWIQFMNHDWLTHGRNEESNPHIVKGPNGYTKEIERTQVNDVSPSNYDKKFGKTTLNEVTHWWDGSQIYGSNRSTQETLRTFENGAMKLTNRGGGKYRLPLDEEYDTRFERTSNKQNFGRELAGFRENWWVGLSMLHLLFVKEHNSIAKMLMDEYVSKEGNVWVFDERTKFERVKEKIKADKTIKTFNTAEELDEHIFQVARMINAAVMAKIHTVEWTPAILKNDTLKTAMYANWYGLANPNTLLKSACSGTVKFGNRGLNNLVAGGIVGGKMDDSGVPYSISEEFTSVYRLHPLLPETIHMRKVGSEINSKIPMAATRNEKSDPIMVENDIEDLFYSFGRQLPGQLVLNNTPAFMQNLEIPGRPNMDLAMVDILRDRERAVPRYNQFRRAIGLIPIKSYRDFFPKDVELDERQKEVIAKLEKVYGKDGVEDIDMLVGAYAEEVRPENFGFGETQFQIFILMASRRLMADRFFTDDYNRAHYTKKGLEWIDKKGCMDRVITRHMPSLAKKVEGLDSAFSPWNK